MTEGGSGSYTVKLTSQPTDTVTVSVSTDAGVTVDTDANTDGEQTTLSFTTTNWSTPQTVEVSAGQDDDAVDDTVTLSHTASGGDYASVTGDLVVTVTDDDTAGLVLTPSSLTLVEGGSSSYTVALNSQPTAAVTVTVSAGQGVVTRDTDPDTNGNQSTLSFTTANWNTPQTVELGGRDDADTVDDTVTMSHIASGGDYDSALVTANLSVVVIDDDKAPALVLTPSSLTVAEAEDTSYTVALAGAPTAAVTVTVTVSPGSEVTVDTDATTNGNQTTLSFTSANWNTPQTVDVSAEQDDDAVDETVTLAHTASGGDYDSLTADLSVTVDDDETAALVFTPASLTVPEGESGSYTVALASQPTAAVTVTVSAGAGAGVTADTDAGIAGIQNTLSFTTANWSTPQIVQVSTEGHDDDAADETVALSHTASGGDYASVSSDLVVTVSDDETAALVLTPSSLTLVGGGDGSYTVALASQPTASVTVSVSTGSGVTVDTDAATNGNQSNLSFTTTNWSIPQTVKLEVGKNVDETVTLTHSASGGDYDSLTANLRVNVKNICERMDAIVFHWRFSPDGTHCDLSSKGIKSLNPGDFKGLSKISLIYLNGNRLSTLPEGVFDGLPNLRVIDLNDNRITSLPENVFAGRSQLRLIYLQRNKLRTLPVNIFDRLSNLKRIWLEGNNLRSLPQGVFDGLSELTHLYLHDNSLGSLPDYIFDELSDLKYLYLQRNDLRSLPENVFAGLSDLTHLYLNGNNGLRNLPENVFSGLSKLRELNMGTSDLRSLPENIFTGLSNLRFLHLNWLKVKSLPEDIFAGLSNLYSIYLNNSSLTKLPQEIFSGLSNLKILDLSGSNSLSCLPKTPPKVKAYGYKVRCRNLVLTPIPLEVAEGGSASYTVALDSAPTGTVKVTVSSGAGVTVDTDADTSGNQNKLSFTTANWDTPQTVEVSAGQDDGAVDDTVRLAHRASGNKYNAVMTNLSVNIIDDDKAPALVITPTSLTVAEGDGASYTVALAGAPTGAVTVTVSAGSGDVTVDTDADTSGNQTSLSFTSANWNTPQTVELSAAQDDDAADETVTLSHSASGGDYGSVSGDLVVTVSDDETAALVFTPSSLNVNRGHSDNYTVALASPPIAAVTVTVSTSLGGVTVDTDADTNGNQTSLSFTSANWSTPQPVEVSVGKDVDGDTVTLSHIASGGDYGSVMANLSVNLQNICKRLNVLSSNGKTCDLSSKAITSLKSGDFDRLSNLTDLYLNDNNLSSLPEDIFAGLSDLDTLYLDDNNLSNLPEDIFDGLSDLHTLHLNNNNLSNLPEDIFADLSDLNILFLNDNNLSSLPEDIFADVSDMQALVLSHNNLSSLSEDIFDGFSYILVLSLDNNNLTSLPEDIFDDTFRLLNLGLSDNNLTSLPEDIFDGLSKLLSLTLSNNNLTSLPKDIFDGLSDLDNLYLSGNSLTCFPRNLPLSVEVTPADLLRCGNLVLTPSSLTVGEGGSGSYTVALNSLPTAAVTVAVTVGSGSGVTVDTDAVTNGNQTSLSFTTANWNTPQTVEVSAGQDNDAVDDSVTLSHSASGGDYDSATANLSVTVADDDKAPGLVLTPSSLTVAEAEDASYTVALAGAPTAAVTVTVSVSPDSELTVDTDAATNGNQTSLSFTTTNWYIPQAVEVSAGLDNDTEDDIVTLSHSASGGGYGSVTANLSVTITDGQTAAHGSSGETMDLVLTPSSLTLAKGGSGSYTVALVSAPNAAVVMVTVSTGSDVTVDTDSAVNGNQNTLTFTTANWITPQTVQVSLGQDVDDTVTLSHKVSGGNYDSVTANLRVNVTDDQAAALVLTPSSLTLAEGGSGSYTVALNSRPTAAVTVSVSPGSGVTVDTDDDTKGNQSTLTFTTRNWNKQQTVEVSAGQDTDAVNDTVTLAHSASGGDYDSATANLRVNVTDDEAAALVFTPSSLTLVGGGSGSYTVALNSAPTTAVMVIVSAGPGVTVDTDAAANGNQHALSFTTANWSTPQTVEMNVGPDVDDTVTLTHTASGGNYGSVTANLRVNVENICERFDALSSNRKACDLSSKGISTLSPGDFDGLPNLQYISLHSNALSSLPEDSFAGLSDLRTLYLFSNDLSNLPEDIFAGLSNLGQLWLTNNDLSSLPEDIFDGLSDLHTLLLDYNDLSSLPEDIFAGLSNLEQLMLNNNNLSSLPEDIFAELSDLRTLYLNNNDLSSLPEDIFAGLSNLRTLYLYNNDLSSLPEDIFAGLSDLRTLYLNNNSLICLPRSLPLSVRVTGADLPRCGNLLVLTPSSLTLAEGGSGSYTVALASEPTAAVTVTVSPGSGMTLDTDADTSGNQTSLSFTTANWSTPQTVDVSAGQDDDAIDDTVTLAHSASGGDYRFVSGDLVVAISDDDKAPALVFTPESPTLPEAGSGSYTVALAGAPTAAVTVTVSPGSGVTLLDTDADTNGNQTSLSFTTANWNTPQTLGMSAEQDSDAVDDTVTLSHSASGGDYDSVSGDLVVTVSDDETAALVLTPSSLTLAEGGSGSYTMALASEPTAAVTVTVSPGAGVTLDTDAATSGNQTSLSFTTANWNTPQTLTLSAEQDADAVDDTVTLSHTASGGDYGSVTASLSVTVSDDETPALVLTPSSLTLAEGGSSSYTMALASEPTAAVTVTVSPGAGVTLDTDAATSGNQNSLSFTTANWNTPQTLTLSAEQDADAVDDTVTLSHAASGGDYGSVTGDMVVTVSDDETAALLLTPSSLTLVGGGNGSYTVALASAPTAAVTVTVTSDPGAGVTLDTDAATNGNQNSLSFTATNWSTPQTVDLSVGQDVDDTVTLSHSASGGDYDSVTLNLSINVQNICERMDALNSNGKTCNLSSKEITSLNSGDFDGLSNLQKLYLNNNKLSGLPEDVFDGLSKLRNLRLDNNDLSSLPEDVFDGLAKLKSLNLNKNDLSSLPEDIFAGLSKLQNLRLHSNNLSSLPEDVFAGLSKLQNLRLHSNALSSLPEDVFAGLSDLETLNLNGNGLICLPRSLPLSVTVDAELPRCGNFLTLTPSSLTVAEAGSGSYTVVLASEPTAAVTVTVSPGAGVTLDTDAATDGNQTSLSFSTSNWSTPQIVDVSAGQDDDAVDDTVTLAHSASGGDYRFVSGDLVVAITDDDKAPALVFTPESPTVAEGGSGSYTVRLAGSPSAAVTLTISAGAGVTLDTDADTDGNQNTLSFSTANWNTPQTVEVSGEQDDDAVDDTVMLAHTASGGDYDSVAANLSVAITDDDKAPALVFTPESPTVVEGGSSSYTVALAGSPSAAVTVSLTPGSGVTLDTDADTDGNQTSLSFSAANWNTPQTVEVSGEQDDDAVDEIVTLAHTASGGDYDLVTANLSVAVTDDDKAPALVFSSESLTVAEAGSGSYTVALAGSPSAAVTVSLTPGSGVTLDTDADTDGNQTSLSFSAANWNTPQTVEVSAEQDDDAVDDTVTLAHSASGGDYDSVSGDLVVTVSDDDKAPALVLTPENLTVAEGESGSYTVALAGSPSAAVTVAVSVSTGSEVTVDTDATTNGNQNSLSFTTTNWYISQTVEVSAELDNDTEDDTVTLSHTVSGGDYGSVTGDLVVTVSDDETNNNTNTTAALPSWITADGTLEPLTLYVGGEDGSRDGSDAFSVDNDDAADITWRFTSSHPAVASVSEEPSNNPIVMVTPVREGEATITVRVANGNRISGPASFLVTVVTSPAEETAIRAGLSGQGRVILGSVTDMIGKRFDSGTGGNGSSGSVCLNSAAGADGESATSDESGSSSDNAIAGSYGESSDYLIASDIWQGESWNTDLAATGLRGVPHVGQRDDEDSMDKTFDDLLELFRGQPHSLHPADWGLECGSGAVAEVSRPWTLWAGTDLQWARGGTETSDFDGEWQLYYLGADRAFREQWLAGLSLSQVQGEVDYSFEDATAAGAGQLSSSLTAIYPYLHGQLSSNLELWAIGGIGFGDVENEREHVDGDADQGDLHMRLLSLGLRRPLSQAGSTIDLALTSDAGFLNLSAEGDGSLDGAEASIGRFRLGLELSRPFASGVEPFAQLHGRYDSGDGPTGAAGEVVLGLRYGDERFNLELRGNHLTSAAELEQWGAKARLDYSPATNGTGLNLALTSQWGAAENGDSFLDGHSMELPTPALVSAQSDGDSLPVEISGEIGYSLSMGQQWGILTPNLGYDHSDNGSSRSRVGLAYALSSALDRDIELRLDLARREQRQEDPDHSIELSTTLRF